MRACNKWGYQVELAVLLVLAFVVGQLIFCGWLHDMLGLYTRGFWAFPFVIWAALRFGVRNTIVTLLMYFAQSLWGVLNGMGFFATDLADTRLFNFLLFHITLISVGMGLAISNSKRVATETHLQTILESAHAHNHELDLRIQEAVQASKAKDLLLQQQSRLAGMGEMIGNIAHQWRQPLNSLGLILSDMEDAYVHGECDSQYLHSAVAQSHALIKKMTQTIDDFINFFREDKHLGTIYLRRETESCLQLISATLQHHKISAVIHCPQEVKVMGYANEFSQALMNLLTNAKDAILASNVADGNISIDISENDQYGKLTISDNGDGIAEEILPRIFDPYFTTKPQGIGIGLYISRIAIEKNMGGSLEAKNVESGAQFVVRLPKINVLI